MKLFHHKTEGEVTAPAPAPQASPDTTESTVPPATDAAPSPPEATPAPRWPTMPQWFDTAFAAADPIHIEERRDGDTLVVRAELPGIDPTKDVEVTVSNGMLRIHGERREETSSDEPDHYRHEYRFGAFTRVLPLPAGATEADVTAEYADGFLEVRVPMDFEEAAARTVPVTTTA